MFCCCWLSINKIKRSLIQKMYIGSSWNVYRWWILYSGTLFPIKLCNWAKFLNVELCEYSCTQLPSRIIIELAGATHIPPMTKNVLHLFFKKYNGRHQYGVVLRKSCICNFKFFLVIASKSPTTFRMQLLNSKSDIWVHNMLLLWICDAAIVTNKVVFFVQTGRV